jgi:hypothetical protein
MLQASRRLAWHDGQKCLVLQEKVRRCSPPQSRDLIEEPERTVGLRHDRLGSALLLDEVVEIGADIFFAELFRRLIEVADEFAHAGQIADPGMGAVILQCHVCLQPFVHVLHNSAPFWEGRPEDSRPDRAWELIS